MNGWFACHATWHKLTHMFFGVGLHFVMAQIGEALLTKLVHLVVNWNGLFICCVHEIAFSKLCELALSHLTNEELSMRCLA